MARCACRHIPPRPEGRGFSGFPVMADADLIFDLSHDPGLPAPLVFGEEGGWVAPDAPFTLRGTLPKLKGRSPVAVVKDVGVAGRLPALRGRLRTRYSTDTQRPTVNATLVAFEVADRSHRQSRIAWDAAEVFTNERRGRFQQAVRLPKEIRSVWQETKRVPNALSIRFQEGIRLPIATVRTLYQEAIRLRDGSRVRFQEGIRLDTPLVRLRYQETIRNRRNYTAVRFQEGVPYFASWVENGGYAAPIHRHTAVRYQLAMRPPIGRWKPEPPKPPFEPCYVPEIPAHLVFGDLWVHSPHLIFSCDKSDPPGPQPGETVVVPVKEVYLTINSAVLTRVDNGQLIPTHNMSMSLDVDSWTWGFSASVPGAALPFVLSNAHGDPVVVQATVNGIDFRFALETPQRDRSFNNSTIRLSGRGLGAELDEPNSVVRTFTNPSVRNARQLLDDILTFNGISIGWEIGLFEPTDWEVPAGVFNHTGSYISAINAVVGAAGAYVQPHNTSRTLDVRLRYPTPYWEWGSVTPDFEIPEAVATQESITWTDKPVYNRVYVTGEEHGIVGRYTRTGTAGDLVAQTVVDPLVTHAAVARQRGRAIICDTGRVATVTLRLPLLAETGLIKPGAFVRYVEGGNTRLGLTRSVSLDVGLTDTYQTIALETHVEPV